MELLRSFRWPRKVRAEYVCNVQSNAVATINTVTSLSLSLSLFLSLLHVFTFLPKGLYLGSEFLHYLQDEKCTTNIGGDTPQTNIDDLIIIIFLNFFLGGG